MKWLHLVSGTLLTVSLLCGCASNSSSMDSASSSTSSSSSSTTASPESGLANSSTQYYNETLNGTKLVYTGTLRLETIDFEETAQSLSDTVKEYEGYFSSSNVNQYGSGYQYGEYTVRIPSQYYDDFHNAIGEFSLVVQDRTTVEDISTIYYDTQGRLETQQIKLDRLQALLEQATTMEDLITIESAISDTQWQIDTLSGEMTYYDSIVDYATITLYLEEVYQLSNVQEAPKTFGQRISNGFVQGSQSFVTGLENLIVTLAYHWATLLILVVVAVVVVNLRVKRNKKKVALYQQAVNDKPNVPTGQDDMK